MRFHPRSLYRSDSWNDVAGVGSGILVAVYFDFVPVSGARRMDTVSPGHLVGRPNLDLYASPIPGHNGFNNLLLCARPNRSRRK